MLEKFSVCNVTSINSIKSFDGVSNSINNLSFFLKKKKIKSYTIKPKDFFFFLSVLKKIKIINIHGCWSPYFLIIFLISKILKKKIVVNTHGMLSRWSFNYKKTKKIIAWYLYQRFIINNADLIIVNSQIEYNQFKEKINNYKVKIIFNGINPPLLDKSILFNKKITKKALFFSRIHPIKGLKELILAWSKSKFLKKNKFILNVYGAVDDYKYLNFIKSLIKKKKLSNQIFVYANENVNKWNVYSNHDFLVLPSYTESFGIVVAEALYSGIPVITSTETPWKNIEELSYGKVVNIDVNSLTKALDSLSYSIIKKKITYQKRNEMRSYVIKNFSWKYLIEHYVIAFKKII